jgi:hypothetical protein
MNAADKKTMPPSGPISQDNKPPMVKSSSRRLLIGIIPGILLVAAVAVIINIGSLAKSAAERIASQTLGVRVMIGTLAVTPADKTVIVTGLRIANPAEFRQPAAFTFDRVSIAAESLAPDLLVFRRVSVDGTDVNLEVADNDTNLTAIRRNVNERAATASAAKPVKVIVRELVFNGMTVHPSGKAEGMKPVDISTLRITGIGERSNGVLAPEAIAQILERVAKTSFESGLQAGFLKEMSPAALATIKSQFGIAEGFKAQAKQGFENLKTGIRNLFGGNKAAPAAPNQSAP